MIRKFFVLAATVGGLGAAGFLLFGGVWPAAAGQVVVYKSPSCECCEGWVAHMRQNGFDVVVRTREDMDPVKARHHVPRALESCHTAVVAGYTVEGHVPAADVKRLLAEKPAARGIAVPGMPSGSPGMENGAREAFAVVLFTDQGGRTVYARH